MGFVFILCFAALVHVSSTSVILAIGDSWAQGIGESLASVCAGSTVVNRGASGSTAVQWTTGSCPDIQRTEGRQCSLADAFSNQWGSGYTHAILFLPYNDYMNDGCAMSRAQVSSLVRDALAAVKSAAPDGMRILMTGYCVPSASIEEGSCTNPDMMVALNGGIKDACDVEAACTFVDATSVCGGNTSAWSTATYFEDNIHINEEGYARLFSTAGVQSALSCGGAPPPSPTPTTTASPSPVPTPMPVPSPVGAGPIPIPAPTPVEAGETVNADPPTPSPTLLPTSSPTPVPTSIPAPTPVEAGPTPTQGTANASPRRKIALFGLTMFLALSC
eukprot:TRINITY_DN12267_c0_g1_i1.p1 TRINITY_DN12267_c0_g1~~TRINITY_DN12267_c0_g1_i1.p1  ORF type:complete len:332 (+),score=31.73 TRINITY_DN12267_c0_g1_i1:49-1044(+)